MTTAALSATAKPSRAVSLIAWRASKRQPATRPTSMTRRVKASRRLVRAALARAR